MNDTQTVAVWDVAVRLFHWTLVAAFATAFLTDDDAMAVHTWAGYMALALVGFRLVWGIVGTRHARFSDFVRPPREILAYLHDVVTSRARRYLGHNPAGGAMILALLAGLLLTGFTGLAVYGAKEAAGPLAPFLAGMDKSSAKTLKEIHELIANLTLGLVGLHVLGVILASRQHGESLVRAMLTGRKPTQSL